MPPRPSGAGYGSEEGTSSTGRSDDCNKDEYPSTSAGPQSVEATAYRTCGSPCQPSKHPWAPSAHVDCVPQLPPLPAKHLKGYAQKGSQHSLISNSSDEITIGAPSAEHHQAEMPVKAFLSPPQIYEHVADAGGLQHHSVGFSSRAVRLGPISYLQYMKNTSNGFASLT